MWSVGGDVKFIPATQDAKKGLVRGIERATAALNRGVGGGLTQEWVPRHEEGKDQNPKSRWIVDDAPYVAPTDRALDEHLKLEQLVPRHGSAGGGGGGDGRDSDDDRSDSDSLEKEIRKLQKVGKKRRARARAGGGDSCLLYTSPSPRDATLSRMPSSA